MTPGQAADCKAAEALLTNLPPRCIVLADRAYDTNLVRQLIEAQGAAPNIPSKVTRLWKSCLSPVLYKGRNAIERMFCRIKDYRRIPTRYDKLADNFLAQRPPRRRAYLVVVSAGPSGVMCVEEGPLIPAG